MDIIKATRYQSRGSFLLIFIVSLFILFYPIQNSLFDGIGWGDKIIHFILFFFLSFFALAGWPLSIKKVIVFILVYALLSEVLQEFYVPGRSFQLYDLVADTVGLIAALLIFYPNKNKYLTAI